MMMLLTCRICGTTDNAESYVAREKMFGFGDPFTYLMCAQCGCLQIENPDIDVTRYYPEKYYSFNAEIGHSYLKDILSHWRNASAVFSKGGVGRALLRLRPNAPLQSLSSLEMCPDMRIADVGCGAGHLLYELRSLGFTDLNGIDPNVESDITVDNHLRIRKACLEQVGGEFDLIMFHHSLEHIPDQLSVLTAAHRVLVSSGVCLVRIPLVSFYAWRTYGTDWVQLDAPRHLYLHSEMSMRLLARRVGFNVEDVIYDSSEFQFWGSEVLRQGFPIFDSNTGRSTPKAMEAARGKRRGLRRKARLLNHQHEGDQAIFLLRPIPENSQAA